MNCELLCCIRLRHSELRACVRACVCAAGVQDLVLPSIMGSPGYESSPLNLANLAAAKAQGRDLDAERNGILFFAVSVSCIGLLCGPL
jgi:hypothetical protein